MHILQVSTLYPPDSVGGAERTAEVISAVFQQNGDSVSIATTSQTPGVEVQHQDDTTVHRVGLKNIYWPFNGTTKNSIQKALWHYIDRSNRLMGAQFSSLLDEIKPDMILTHNLQGWSCAVWEQAMQREIPVVHMLHDHSLVCPRTTMHKEDRNCESVCRSCAFYSAPRIALTRKLSGIVSVSQSLYQRHIELNAIPAEIPSVVIHNSLPESHPILNKPREMLSPMAPLRVGFLGRVEKVKGVEILFRACEILNEQQLNKAFTLRIAGSGTEDYLPVLKKSFPNVTATFLGPSNAMAFMDSVDVLVVPSLMSEGLGNVAIEGMARGAVVIASDLGGLREVLDFGRAGILVPPSDSQALANKLKELIASPELVASLSELGRSRAKHFSKEIQSSKLCSFISKVTSAKVTSAR